MTKTIPNFSQSPSVDQVSVEERVARFNTRSIKKQSKLQGLKLALNMIDLTTLEGKDTPGKVKQMCYKAMHPCDSLGGLPTVAAVCVYPTHVKTAKDALKGSNVKVASVATAFPSGNSTLAIKLADTKFAVDNGADEIDMVISRGEFLSGNYSFVFDEIAVKDEIKTSVFYILCLGSLPFIFSSFKNNSMDRYIGELSFSIYISHLVLVSLFRGYFFSKPELIPYYGYTVLICSLLLALILQHTFINRIENYRHKKFS